jgi:L-aspartate oxidase
VISAPKRCYGAYVISITDQKIIKITSKISILSTGGAGQLFEFTTNPKGATGDGLGAAYRAKVQIKNLPYVQFHPTVLYSKVNDDSFLITEAIRGKGAKLKNINGEKFMHKYDDRGELASRDIVSRAISSEMKKNGSKYVLLDASSSLSSYLCMNFSPLMFFSFAPFPLIASVIKKESSFTLE